MENERSQERSSDCVRLKLRFVVYLSPLRDAMGFCFAKRRRRETEEKKLEIPLFAPRLSWFHWHWFEINSRTRDLRSFPRLINATACPQLFFSHIAQFACWWILTIIKLCYHRMQSIFFMIELCLSIHFVCWLFFAIAIE